MKTRSHHGRSRHARGFTLMEMMVVMGIIAMLFGMGVGMLSSLNPGKQAALGLVQNIVRSAHNNAIARSAPARVRLDPATNTLFATGMDVVGTWQFENLGIEGSSDFDGVSTGGRIVDDGFLGKALSFAGQPAGSHAEIPLHQNPAFDLREGFQILCAFRMHGSGGGKALDFGSVASIEFRSNGSVRAWFKPEVVSASGVVSGGGMVAVDSPEGVWSTGRWMRVEVSYDRRLLQLACDGVVVARAASQEPVWTLQGPLLIGELRTPFPGDVDALSIQAVVDSKRIQLPKTVTFSADAPKEIVFSGDGALDREVHAGPLSIGLDYEDGTKGRVLVNVYGTVE
ncbi:MAG TPA: prepilin-type N-terminal cleavage/methylation domain-containing protein [Planctomycetota bacterium]|nr:prepilin-type N-terminal cleavage/methylation domain-containing protein [Planctomycetota bacterium]